jgi:hypothetical protein
MKWAKVTAPASSSKGNPCSKLQDRNDQLCFKIFKSQAELEKTMASKDNLWAQYDFEWDFSCEEREANKDLQKKSPEKFEQLMEKVANENFIKFQDRYSNFTGGFLEFYDRIVRRRNTDHTIHLKWLRLGRGKEKNLYSVQIFLFPAPSRYRPHAQSNNGVAITDELKKAQNYSTAGNDNSDDFATDPPPPPPPPPPTMH